MGVSISALLVWLAGLSAVTAGFALLRLCLARHHRRVDPVQVCDRHDPPGPTIPASPPEVGGVLQSAITRLM